MKLAILANTNLNYVIKIMRRDHDVYMAEGYGNELGTLLNKKSSYYDFNPDVTFVIMDLLELLGHSLDLQEDRDRVRDWFRGIEACLEPGKRYYISDAVVAGQETALFSAAVREELLRMWNACLFELAGAHDNVRVFPYSEILSGIGFAQAYSYKTWYMGKILIGMDAQRLVAERIARLVALEDRVPKKVLVLDLDNTLWGGLAGEHDISPVELSEEHSGLIYKNGQRIIKLMQQGGVLLAIASKNNEEDAMHLLETHPHMVLRPDDFAARRINWNSKDISIRELAAELNLGLDSFVFWDDSPAERELVRQMLPEVTVPDFPENIEDLPSALVGVYHSYFEKAVLTQEDLDKTGQYRANRQRNELRESAIDFGEYLRQLEIVVTRVDNDKHRERILQLVNKTNQFNLTTKRYSESELAELLRSEDKRVLAYRVTDQFGDNGITAVVVVAFDCGRREALIEEFAMSCRIMGRQIEYAILSDVEACARERQMREMIGRYIPSGKNMPVRDFYKNAGYAEDGAGEFRLDLAQAPARDFAAEIRRE